MPGQKGNKSGIKLKASDVRQEAYKQYCVWIAKGYPKQSFFFDHPTHSVSWETLEKYIKDTVEFDPILMQKAKAERYKKWFAKGENLCDGKVKGNPSPQVWQTIMRNMFKEYDWETPQNQTVFVRTAADEIIDRIHDNH